MNIDDVEPAPWSRYQWSGELRSVDGTAIDDFTRDDVAEIIDWYSSGDRWDGHTAGIALLKDGRVISWEANYGPTGDGFSCDAYGGEADIFFAASVDRALTALGDDARASLGRER